MENERHLEYFKIENFKGLESFELKDLARFNLILGDNNIGKTSVLEALLFDELPYVAFLNIYSVFLSKGGIDDDGKLLASDIDYFRFFVDSSKTIQYTFKHLDSTFNTLKIKNVNTGSLSQVDIENLMDNTFVTLNQLPRNVISFELNGMENFFTANFRQHRSSVKHVYYPFIESHLTYKNDLVEFFSKTVNSDVSLKQEFVSNLHLLSEDIYDIIIDTTTVPGIPVLMVLFNDEKKPIPLFMMGDGTLRLVRIILEIILCKDGRLMIDEIDNGMHFSKMKFVWNIVLKVALKHNTQLFITTHDEECLRAFKEALEESELEELQKDVACYTLFRNKNNLVDSVRYNFGQFEHAIDHSLNVRG